MLAFCATKERNDEPIKRPTLPTFPQQMLSIAMDFFPAFQYSAFGMWYVLIILHSGNLNSEDIGATAQQCYNILQICVRTSYGPYSPHFNKKTRIIHNLPEIWIANENYMWIISFPNMKMIFHSKSKHGICLRIVLIRYICTRFSITSGEHIGLSWAFHSHR